MKEIQQIDIGKALQKEAVSGWHNCVIKQIWVSMQHIHHIGDDVLWLAQIFLDAWAVGGLMWIVESGHHCYSVVAAIKLIH